MFIAGVVFAYSVRLLVKVDDNEAVEESRAHGRDDGGAAEDLARDPRD